MILDEEMGSNITVEDIGFKVDSYEDPILTVENFKSYSYDLVILDIKMLNLYTIMKSGSRYAS